MPVNTAFMVVLPLFWLLFVLLYTPLGLHDFLNVGQDRFPLNLIITTLTVLGVVAISRMLLFLLRRVLSLSVLQYVLWNIVEVFVAGLFLTIPLGIGWAGDKPYFSVMIKCVADLAAVELFPYVILNMWVALTDLAAKKAAPQEDTASLIRFTDEMKRTKLVVATSAIYYLESDENYVHIIYLDNGKVKDYCLRSSMRSLEGLLEQNSFVRCHRSYYVNPRHVTLVRKDTAGFALAQLDNEVLKPIPVSRRFYESVISLL